MTPEEAHDLYCPRWNSMTLGCRNNPTIRDGCFWLGLFRKLVLTERERCAKVVGPTKWHPPTQREIRRSIAKDIRE
jgi:hypothetical protein